MCVYFCECYSMYVHTGSIVFDKYCTQYANYDIINFLSVCVCVFVAADVDRRRYGAV